MYAVLYTTVYGNYEEQFTTEAEANKYATKLKELNKQPGYLAAGVRVKEVV